MATSRLRVGGDIFPNHITSSGLLVGFERSLVRWTLEISGCLFRCSGGRGGREEGVTGDVPTGIWQTRTLGSDCLGTERREPVKRVSAYYESWHDVSGSNSRVEWSYI